MRGTLLLLSIPVTLTLCAQSPYRPFPDGNAGWVENHSWLQPGGNNGYVYNTSTRTIRFGTDTVIGATTYHQLYSRGQGTWQTTQVPVEFGSFTEPDGLFTPFRQDIAERKVYAYDLGLQQEVLWFDFTLGLGPYPDTFHSQPGNGVEVVALDSMQLGDGYHRTWVLGLVFEGQLQDSAFCTVIEGVGPTYGLNTVVGLVPPFEWGDMLLCHQRNGVDVFSLFDMPCDLSMAVNDPKAVVPEAIVATPNPAHDRVRLAGAPTGGSCTVLDAAGRIQHTMRLTDASIDLNGLASGVYLLRITAPDGTLAGQVRVMKD